MDPAATNERERLLLQEGAALRAIARSLVRGDDVDDVVQSTHAAALAAPAATDGFLPPWLRVTLHNLARGLRRGDARRRAREQVVADASAAAPSAAALAMQAELVRDVGTAVHALDEPFRTAVLLRYWHGLMPDAIAERLGVPRNTVRSRLQRGLDRLRTELDRSHGDRQHWQRALAPFAGTPAAAIAGAGAATSLLGWIMHSKTFTAAAAALFAALVGAWWWQQPAMPAGGPAATGGGAASVAVAERAPDTIERSEAVPAVSAPAAAPAVLPSPYHVVVRGRCVDERSIAVADARIDLRAVLPVPMQLDADSARAQTRSAEDGTFALMLVPGVAIYELDVQATGLVALRGRWDEVEPGHTYDLGDIVLQRGGAVTGRAVDPTGTPRPGVLVRVGPRRPTPFVAGAPLPIGTVEIRTTRDGTFVVPGPLAPGDWVAGLSQPREHGEGAPSVQFRIEAGVTTTGIELLCKAATGALRGQVVDELGLGVAGARVTRSADLFAQPTVADANGWFELSRFALDTAATVALEASADGYELVRAKPVAWDSEARIVLPACPGVTIEVRAHDGRLADPFGLRLSATLDGSPTPGLLRAVAVVLPCVPRASRQVRLPGLPRGRYIAWVEPRIDGSAPFFASILVDAATQRHVLHAPAAGTRRVRIVDASTRPIAGTAVELVQSIGATPAGAATPALSPRSMNEMQALLLQRANTDAAGELELTAAAGTPYTVRALGPGHRPVAVADVRLDPGLDVLVLRTDAGATVTGTFGPPELLARLGPSADDVRNFKMFGERGTAIVAGMRPVVVLRPAGGGKDFPENANDGAVQDDGSFRVDGVPPGSWRVCVRHRPLGPGIASGVKACTELAMLRDLAPGEHRRIELDGSGLRAGSLRALVLVDGEPFANAEVHVRYRRPGLTWGTHEIAEATPEPTRTDADGRFAIEASPGEYGVEVHLTGAKGGTAKVRNDQFVTVVAGAAVDATFTLQRRTLRVRVLRAEGTPEGNRKFSTSQEHAMESAGITDADGWLEIASVPAGAFELVTWPTELADTKAQTEYIRAHPYPQWLDALVRVGPVEMKTGEARAEIELRLPPGREVTALSRCTCRSAAAGGGARRRRSRSCSS